MTELPQEITDTIKEIEERNFMIHNLYKATPNSKAIPKVIAERNELRKVLAELTEKHYLED